VRRLRLVPLCAALVLAPSSAAAVKRVDSGIVIRIKPPRVVAIRELDGTRLRFAINRATVVTLNGRRVRLFRLQRGDVATVEHRGRVVTAVRAVRP
jgi:nitrous oxidase accessory protein NosD